MRHGGEYTKFFAYIMWLSAVFAADRRALDCDVCGQSMARKWFGNGDVGNWAFCDRFKRRLNDIMSDVKIIALINALRRKLHRVEQQQQIARPLRYR